MSRSVDHGRRIGVIARRLALLIGLAWPAATLAGELSDFHEMVADAYAPYRGAVFYLRTGNPGVAALELDRARQAWEGVVARFADGPPDGLADDETFDETLYMIGTSLENGLTALDRDDLEAAKAALEPVRETLSALRRRNGLRIFGDCIDEMNAAMARLWVFRHEPPAFDRPDEVNEVRKAAAITHFLYQKCHGEAPKSLSENAEFQRLFDGSLLSLPLIFEALDQGEEVLLINILRELRSFDDMIWLRFG